MQPKYLQTLQHAKTVGILHSQIRFYQDQINRLELKKQRSISGAGLKSLSVAKAIEHLELLHERITDALRRSGEYHDAGHPEEYENYDRLADWQEMTERQLKEAKASQRKRINVYEFSYELLDAIKERVSITDMLKELKIRLRRSGGNRYVIICPFHDEKSPSCMIYAEDDKFHCFGCQANGDVIDFYRMYLDLEFDEALTTLAERLNIQVMDAEKIESVSEEIQRYQLELEILEKALASANAEYARKLSAI